MTDKPSLPALREAVAKMTPGPWKAVGIHISPIMETGDWSPSELKAYEDAAVAFMRVGRAPSQTDLIVLVHALAQRLQLVQQGGGGGPQGHDAEEDGESCENETHTCLRVCRSVAAEFEASQKALSAERIEIAHLREAFVTMERAANQHETDLAAARAVLDGAYRLPRGTSPDNSIHLCVNGAAWLAWQARETDHMAEVGKLVIPAMEREDA